MNRRDFFKTVGISSFALCFDTKKFLSPPPQKEALILLHEGTVLAGANKFTLSMFQPYLPVEICLNEEIDIDVDELFFYNNSYLHGKLMESHIIDDRPCEIDYLITLPKNVIISGKGYISRLIYGSQKIQAYIQGINPVLSSKISRTNG